MKYEVHISLLGADLERLHQVLPQFFPTHLVHVSIISGDEPDVICTMREETYEKAIWAMVNMMLFLRATKFLITRAKIEQTLFDMVPENQ